MKVRMGGEGVKMEEGEWRWGERVKVGGVKVRTEGVKVRGGSGDGGEVRMGGQWRGGWGGGEDEEGGSEGEDGGEVRMRGVKVRLRG